MMSGTGPSSSRRSPTCCLWRYLAEELPDDFVTVFWRRDDVCCAYVGGMAAACTSTILVAVAVPTVYVTE